MILKKIRSLLPLKRQAPKKVQGTLTSYNQKKGCGFIQPKSSNKKVFVLFTEMNDRIERGDKVLFDLYNSPLGVKARNVELANA